MPLNKYYDEVAGLPNRIDEQTKRSYLETATEVKDITSEGLDFSVTMKETEWAVKEVGILFSGATARDFTIAKKSVANIVANRNDRLWMSVDGVTTRRVTVSEGVYSGSTLAAELKTQMESVFSDLSLTFTVSFSSGKFTITNSGGLDMVFYYVNERVGVRRNSTIAENMGFTQNQGPTNSLTSDTTIDLDSEYPIISETGDTSTSYVITDEFVMDSDSAFSITTTTAGITVTVKVAYEAK